MILRFILIGAVLLSVVFLVGQAYSEETKNNAAKEKWSSPYVVKKIIKQQLPGKTLWWNHGVQICTKDRFLGITEVIFRSDIETIHEGMNSEIAEGKCQYYGTVMKAKNGTSLKYRIVTNEEAFHKINEAKKGNLEGTSWDEIRRWIVIHSH
jgi:hypothetical protein